MFYQELSRQSESSDRVAVFRRTVSTLTHSGLGRPKYEIPEENTYFILNLLVLPGMRLQICYYSRDSL